MSRERGRWDAGRPDAGPPDAKRLLRRRRQSRTASHRADALPAPAAPCAPPDAGRIAADIGATALQLAKYANSVGLTTLGYLLESAALEAGAEAASRAWPDDTAET